MNRRRQGSHVLPSGPTVRFRGNAYTLERAQWIASHHVSKKNFSTALEIYKAILDSHPSDPEAHNNLGFVLLCARELDQALASFEKAIQLSSNYAEAHLNRGAVLQELERFDAALESYNKVVALNSTQSSSFRKRGHLLQLMRRYHESIADYDTAIKLQPESSEAYFQRATVFHLLGRFDEALASYQRVIVLEPHHAFAQNNLGLLFQNSNRMVEALCCFEVAIAAHPTYADAHFNRGVTLQELKRYDDSLLSIAAAIQIKPRQASFYNRNGGLLLLMGRLEDALRSFETALALEPDHANGHFNLATAYQRLGRWNEALASYDRSILINPGHSFAYNNRGTILQELKLFDEAHESFEKAIQLKPDYFEAYNNLGNILVGKGNMAAAESMFHQALALKPDFAASLLGLSSIRKHRDLEHREIEWALGLLRNPGASDEDREHLYFALGKAFDDCGRFDEAFECYRQGNAIKNARVAYRGEMVESLTDKIIEIFTPPLMSGHRALTSDRNQPLFIVGMPRSGTTLMASILSNHPAIETAGELPTIQEFTRAMPRLVGSESPYPACLSKMSVEVAEQMIRDYQARLTRDIETPCVYVIDKHPYNFMHLGLVYLLFPSARIVHCTRLPLDTILSNYFQRLSSNFEYSSDLANIRHFYDQYLRLMQHWRETLPIQIIEASYEDMVLETERKTREILTFLDLEWDERCLSPHTNPNIVETASQWQVRQPIYRDSIGRWKNYEKYLVQLQ